MALGSLLVEINRAAEAEPYFKTAAAGAGGIAPRLALADYYLSIRKPDAALAVLDELAQDPKAVHGREDARGHRAAHERPSDRGVSDNRATPRQVA